MIPQNCCRARRLLSLLLIGVLAFVVSSPRGERPAAAAGQGPQWKLAVQAYTFNHFTFFEAIEKSSEFGF